MALHILQPSLRPIGQFDLAHGQTVTGGEIGIFDEGAVNADEVAAADVTSVGPLDYNGGSEIQIRVKLGGPTAVDATASDSTADSAELVTGLRFLLDEGTAGYGTLFGSAIGGTAGQGVTYGLSQSGAVLANLGPATSYGSGKVTCWHAPGLYAVTGAAAANLGTAELNATLTATTAGILQTQQADMQDAVGIMVGPMYDESLVSTSSLAATGSQATAAKFAFYFLGQR